MQKASAGAKNPLCLEREGLDLTKLDPREPLCSDGSQAVGLCTKVGDLISEPAGAG